MLRIYLDNCCYCRPYDGQEQEKVRRETEAKLFIQSLATLGAVKLVTSFVLKEEVIADSDDDKVEAVMRFITINSPIYVGAEYQAELAPMVADIMKTGIKDKDAVHIDCAVFAKCDYFISTDKRLLKYTSDKIKLLNPIEFKKTWEGMENE